MAKKRIRDKEQKINKIFQSSVKLIEKKGYANVSTNHIAKDANIAIGTLYKYFPDGKPDILQSLFQKIIEQKIEETPLDNFQLKNIEDIRNNNFYRNLLFQALMDHRQMKFMIEAFESECLTNKKFYSNIKDRILSENQLIDLLIKTIFQDNIEKIERIKPGLMKLSQVKEVLIHRHVLFGDIFESDEEFVDILMEIVIVIFNYYMRKQE